MVKNNYHEANDKDRKSNFRTITFATVIDNNYLLLLLRQLGRVFEL